MRHPLRKIQALLALVICALIVLMTTSVGAQDLNKQKRKRDVNKAALEAAAKRQKELSKRLDKDKTKDAKGIPQGPGKKLNKDDIEASKMSIEEMEKLKRELEVKNKGMIQKLQKIIAQAPYDPNKPEWMFQMAELTWELRNWEYLRARAEYNKCLGAADDGNIDTNKCKEPAPNYTKSQKIYSGILKQYPQYDRLDEVIYRLGRGLIKAGKGAQAIPLLNRLVQNYPQSKYLPEAYLALGEFYFDKNLFGAAKDSYTAVAKFKDYSFHDYAIYKLGWVFYNQKEYRASIDTFKSVVEQKEDKLGFQSQAVNDLVVAFAAVDDGWVEAREYFQKMRGIDFTYQKLGQMAGYLEGQGKDEDAVKIFEWFISKRPDHKKIPDWMESVVIAKKKNINDLEGLEVAMNRFVAYLEPEGTWYKKNTAEKGALQNADLLVESSLAHLSNFYHIRAQKNSVRDDFVKAAKYYEMFIKRFPNKSSSFDMNFLLGEIYLIDLKELEKAAAQYQKVVDLYKSNKIPKSVKKKDAEAFVKDSAYALVNAYDELVKKHHPESYLITMAKSSGVLKRDKLDLKSGEVKTPEKLLKYEKLFVKASDQWSEMYPKDNSTPTIDYVSAEVYKSRWQYDRCIPRYENIMTNFPKHKYASYSGGSLLEATYRLKRWGEVERWARYLIKVKNFKVVKKSGLRNTIAYAINENAKELLLAKKDDEAATMMLKLAKEFSDNKELAPGAIFNAAAIYEVGEQIRKAVSTYEMVVKKHPESKQAPEALFAMGAIFESRADFSRAASYFGRLADKRYLDWEKDLKPDKEGKVVKVSSADAIFNSGTLYKAMENWDKTIEVYESYIKTFGKMKKGDDRVKENIRKLQMELARLEMKRKKSKHAIKRFEKALKRKDLTPLERIEALNTLGLLHEEVKGKRWEKISNDYFTKTIKEWEKSKDKLVGQEKDTKRDIAQAARYYAAQAKFRQAERIYGKFVGVKLSYPMKTLMKSLVKKGTYEQEAEKMYLSVIKMSSAQDVAQAAPMWMAAAGYRIGQMYKNFSDELYDLPVPQGLTPEKEDEYRGILDERAFPLQERALSGFQSALRLAVKFKAYNEWSSKSAAQISKLEAEAYPIISQDGVRSDHKQVQFTESVYQVPLDKVRVRLMARKAKADRIKAEEEERKRKEAKAAAEAKKKAAKGQ